jgi:pimeloyl-ACP methyl ester carboxylesterase
MVLLLSFLRVQAPYEDDTMRYTIDGVGLNLFEQGEGEALFFLHYFGGSSRTWKPVIDLLTADNRCLALDLRGWGDSDAVPEAACRVEDMAEDVRQIVAALGLTRYTLVGHSMGGKVALALAADPPPGLTQLLLVAPSPLSPEPMTEDDRAAMRAAYGSEAASRKTLEKIVCLPLSLETTKLVIADNLRASRTAWEAWADIGSKQDLSALAPRITVPTHVLSGTGDAVLSPAALQQLVVDRIPGATLTTVPDAGHLLPLEAPEIAANWIRAYL